MDRESEARAEMDGTVMGRGVRTGLVVAFLAVVWLPFAGELWGVMRARSLGSGVPGRALVSLEILPRVERALRPVESDSAGSVSALFAVNRRLLSACHDYEAQLKDASWLPRALRPPILKAMFSLFRHGGEKAYVGRDGWLFYRADVDSVCRKGFLDPAELRRRAAGESTNGRAPQPDPRAAILCFQRELGRRGIHLLIMPTPVKPVVAAHQLTRDSAPGETVWNESFGTFVEELRAAGVDVFDPAPDLASRARWEGSAPYLRTDTHWRPEAVDQVAAVLAERLQTRLTPGARPAVPALRRVAVTLNHCGDTAALLGFGAATAGAVAAETVTVQEVRDEYGALWQPDPQAAVLLLGDSFTNIYSLHGMGWGRSAGLAEQLSYYLGQPVDCIARNDDGAAATRRGLARDLAAGRDRLAGKKVVVWQFASRELCYGDWERVDLEFRPSPAADFLLPPPGSVLLVSGTIAAVSPAPVPGSVPYKDHVCAIHLVDVTTEGSSAAGRQVVAYLESMRDNGWLPAASLRVGDAVHLRLRPWAEVASRYESVNRTELADVNLQLQEPAWAELEATAVGSGVGLPYGGWSTWVALLVVLGCVSARCGRGAASLCLGLAMVLAGAAPGARADTASDPDNVLHEVANEGGQRKWDGWVVTQVHEAGRSKPTQHPVGTNGHGAEDLASLVASPAAWASPGSQDGYIGDPPAWDGRADVSLLDTDHVWGVGGNPPWVWKALPRGHNPPFMDPYDGLRLGQRFDPRFEPIRRGLGSVDDLTAEWLDPGTGVTVVGTPVQGDGAREFAAPLAGRAGGSPGWPCLAEGVAAMISPGSKTTPCPLKLVLLPGARRQSGPG